MTALGLNLLLGWTVVGWVVALVKAAGPRDTARATRSSRPTGCTRADRERARRERRAGLGVSDHRAARAGERVLGRLDVAHCCTNLAITHGTGTADAFAAAYVAHTGREAQHYFDVMDIVGFLPLPGRDGFIKEEDQRQRLEQRLGSVMRRANARR